MRMSEETILRMLQDIKERVNQAATKQDVARLEERMVRDTGLVSGLLKDIERRRFEDLFKHSK